jgi:hypothetical protein
MTNARAGAVLLGAVAVFWGKSARAQIENIGQAGQVVFGAERLTGIYRDQVTTKSEVTTTTIDPTTGQPITTTRLVDSEITTTTFGVFGMNAGTPVNFVPTTDASLPRLALDFLPIDGLSIGGSFMYLTRSATQTRDGVEDPDDVSVNTLVLYPRVGYAYPFDETFGIWPRVGVVYSRDQLHTKNVNESAGTTTDRTATIHFIDLGLEGMFYISPMKHFAILVGPYGEIGLDGGSKSESDTPGATNQSRDAKATSFGLSVGVVGYF